MTTVGKPEREAGIMGKVQLELGALAVGKTRTGDGLLAGQVLGARLFCGVCFVPFV